MKTILVLEMYGDIPGGIDRDYVSITLEEADKIAEMFAGRWKDSRELADPSLII